jgi:asparagine synthase (glutamine-hydrolysing)
MTGIVGGIGEEGELSRMVDALHREPWYETEIVAEGGYGLGVAHHGSSDVGEPAVWEQGSRGGVAYGGVVDQRPSPREAPELLDAAIDRPHETLPNLDGPFVLAAFDAEAGRTIVATDKIGTRPCYYSTADGFAFGTELKSLVPRIEGLAVDERAITDLVAMGYVLGERTLLEAVRALPPATVLVHEDGALERTRYWDWSLDRREPTEAYRHDLVRTYREAVEDVASTVVGDGWISLSGGLDSRSMASQLARSLQARGESSDLHAYTYDSNPPSGRNPAIARRIASILAIDTEEATVSPDTFTDAIETAIETTDGMLRWDDLINVSTVFDLETPPTTVFEAAGQGELLGEHMWRAHLMNAESGADSIYRSEADVDAETVRSIVAGDVDPLRSCREALRRSDERTTLGKVLDVHYDNYYSRYHYAGNAVVRSRAATRVPFAHGEFLRCVTSLPLDWRLGSYPLTGGRVPYPTSRPKFHLIRALDSDLAAVPYNRTRLAPSRPYWLHAVGFVLAVGSDRLRNWPTHGGPSPADEWYRTHSELQAFVDELLDGAGDRPFFDADAIAMLRREHLAGRADNIAALAPVSTVEYWLRAFVDGRE